jgi:transcriptional regulator with XRE-family HTH domain
MKTFAEIYDSMKDTVEYQVEELSLAFTESILLRMEELGNLSGKELADRMGSTKPYVSKLLKGKNNFTLETLVKLARALECRIEPPQLLPNEKQAPGQIFLFERQPKTDAFRPRDVSVQLTVVAQDNDDNADTAAAA